MNDFIIVAVGSWIIIGTCVSIVNSFGYGIKFEKDEYLNTWREFAKDIVAGPLAVGLPSWEERRYRNKHKDEK